MMRPKPRSSRFGSTANPGRAVSQDDAETPEPLQLGLTRIPRRLIGARDPFDTQPETFQPAVVEVAQHHDLHILLRRKRRHLHRQVRRIVNRGRNAESDHRFVLGRGVTGKGRGRAAGD